MSKKQKRIMNNKSQMFRMIYLLIKFKQLLLKNGQH